MFVHSSTVLLTANVTVLSLNNILSTGDLKAVDVSIAANMGSIVSAFVLLYRFDSRHASNEDDVVCTLLLACAAATHCFFQFEVLNDGPKPYFRRSGMLASLFLLPACLLIAG